jgi:hypothetical protein
MYDHLHAKSKPKANPFIDIAMGTYADTSRTTVERRASDAVGLRDDVAQFIHHRALQAIKVLIQYLMLLQ